MKKFLLLTFALLSAVCGRAEGDLYYGFYTGSGNLTSIGTQKAETYDVAIHFNSPDLVGMTVGGLRIPINTKAKNATNFKAWLTKELKVEEGANVPDICSVDFEASDNWVDVAFAEPYVIPEGGFYAGYTFTISAVDAGNASDANKTPIQCTAKGEESESFIRTSRTYRKWVNFENSISGQGVPALVIRLSGDRVKTRAASLIAPSDLDAYSLVGKSITVPLTLVNHGVETIKNLDYTITLGETVIEKKATLTLQGTYFGRQTTLRATVPAVEQTGTMPIRFTITKINGEANEDPEPSAVYSVAYLNEYPKHKPLMEEYTGTWCGWCPRGMVAMEAMTEIYGDDFVGVAIHEGDPMQVIPDGNFPCIVTGYPHAYIDRVVHGDPYNGTAGTSFGIQKDWKNRQAVISPATLALEADWTDESQTAIRATSRTQFIRDFNNSPYRLTYMLVADELSGKGREWAQANYYSGNSSYAGDKYLAPLVQLSGTIVGQKFNDVAIHFSCIGNTALEGSLPQEVKSTDVLEHTYTIDISENELVQDKTKLRVVVALLNTQTGEVVQAEKATVGAKTAVRSLASENQAVGESYTDLAGRRVVSLGQGIYVRTTRYADGSLRTSKVIRR